MEDYTPYLHFVLIIQPLLFALQLYTYKSVFSKPHRILGAYMLIITAYFFVNAAFITKPLGIDHITYYFITPLFVSLNPFYLLYVKALTTEKFRFKKKFLLHFCPALLLILLNLFSSFGGFYVDLPPDAPIGTKPHADFLAVTLGIKSVFLAIAIYYLQVVTYVFQMIRMLIGHKRKLNFYFSYKENISLNWLWLFISTLLLFTLFDALVYFTTWFESSKAIYFIIMVLFNNFLGYFGLKQTDIYLTHITPVPLSDKPSDNVILDLPNAEIDAFEDTVSSIESKYSGSSLMEDQKNELLQRLIELMEKEHVFQDSNLTINDIAYRLKTNYKYISQVINEKLNRNFYHFVNEYRIEQAKLMLVDKTYDNLSLEGIASMVGFHSRSAFNNAFKKYTGLTPTAFKLGQEG